MGGPLSFTCVDLFRFPASPSFGRGYLSRNVSWASDVAGCQALDTLQRRGWTPGWWTRAGVNSAAS